VGGKVGVEGFAKPGQDEFGAQRDLDEGAGGECGVAAAGQTGGGANVSHGHEILRSFPSCVSDLSEISYHLTLAGRRIRHEERFSKLLFRGLDCRSCRSLLLEAGFVDVPVDFQRSSSTWYPKLIEALANAAVVAGVASSKETDTWLAEQKHRAERGAFFAAVPILMVSARPS
jgi:hypothetical protein